MEAAKKNWRAYPPVWVPYEENVALPLGDSANKTQP